MFNINLATSTSAIQQLKESYRNFWQSAGGTDYIIDLYSLWYNETTINNTIVYGRMYYLRGLQSNPNDLLYWNAEFTYNTITNIYTYIGGSGSIATSLDDGLTSTQKLNLTMYYLSSAIMYPVCFPAGTPVLTDQGSIAIEKINSGIHTIRGNKIVAITKTVTIEDKIVCIEKDSLGSNMPSQKTYISRNHELFYGKQMIKAKHLIGQVDGVYNKKYNGEILYNVLLDKHDKMIVNNLIVETLDPENIIAKLYNGNFNAEEKNNIIVNLNNGAKEYKKQFGKMR